MSSSKSRYPGPQTERDIERLIYLAHEQKGEVLHDMADALMQLILASLFYAPVSSQTVIGDTKFQELIRFLENNIGRDVPLEEMADICGYSVSHFQVMFKKRYGVTAGAYFQKLRMQSAGRKLRETILSIKQIAHECGYDILPNFYRAFNGIYDMTPGEYRRRNLPTG